MYDRSVLNATMLTFITKMLTFNQLSREARLRFKNIDRSVKADVVLIDNFCWRKH